MSREMIDALADSDNLGAETHFKNAFSQKVGDALEIKEKMLLVLWLRNTFQKL